MIPRKKSFALLCGMAAFVASAVLAEPVPLRDGTWKIIPVHGDPIEITEIDAQGKSLFFYKTTTGQESFIDRSNLKNATELDYLVKSGGDVGGLTIMNSKEKEVMTTNERPSELKKKVNIEMQDKPVEITNIETKIVEVDDQSEYVHYTIKATVTNNRESDSNIICTLQAIDHDGFEVESAQLSGEIPKGTSKVLTDKSLMKKINWIRVKEWHLKD